MGLIGGDTARCKTNEEIDAAISTRYSNLENCMFKNFTLLIDSTGLDVPTGNWSATIYRAATNYGYLIASSYASTGHPVSILTRSYYDGVWGEWYKLATASPPAKYYFALTDDFKKLGSAANWYAKDQFNRVTVCIYAAPTSGSLASDDAKVVTTLPVGYRPSASLLFLTEDPETARMVVFSIRNNGEIIVGGYNATIKQFVGEFTFLSN